MKRLSTPPMTLPESKTKRTADEVRTKPRRQTLDFLSRFARVYQAEPALRPELAGYVLN